MEIQNKSTLPQIGSCYEYLYAGPGPDVAGLVLIDIDGDDGIFKTESDCKTIIGSVVRKALSSRFLTLCGAENWRSRITSEDDSELKVMMKHAYAQVFDSDYYKKRDSNTWLT